MLSSQDSSLGPIKPDREVVVIDLERTDESGAFFVKTIGDFLKIQLFVDYVDISVERANA